MAQPEDIILDRFGVDVVDIGRMFNERKEDWYDIELPDGSKAQYPRWFHPQPREDGGWCVVDEEGTEIAVMLENMAFYDQTCFPYLDDWPANFRDLPKAMRKVYWAALAHSPWDNAGRPDFWQVLRERAVALRKQSDRALMIVAGCNLFEWGTFLRRIDNFLMDLVSAPDKVEAFLDALLAIHLQTLQKICDAVGDVADIIRFGDDLGMDTGPLMSPATYRKLFKPRHSILC